MFAFFGVGFFFSAFGFLFVLFNKEKAPKNHKFPTLLWMDVQLFVSLCVYSTIFFSRQPFRLGAFNQKIGNRFAYEMTICPTQNGSFSGVDVGSLNRNSFFELPIHFSLPPVSKCKTNEKKNDGIPIRRCGCVCLSLFKSDPIISHRFPFNRP